MGFNCSSSYDYFAVLHFIIAEFTEGFAESKPFAAVRTSYTAAVQMKVWR